VAVLLYQTTDGEFADRAIAVLEGVGIPAFREGSGENEVLRPRGVMINIYVRESSDYRRASQVLVDIGAAIDKPMRLPTGRVTRVVLLAVGVVVAILFILSKR
jgi:hypothetical protein